MEKLYSAYYDCDGYPFHSLAKQTVGVADPSQMVEKNSALVIWGGSDINPSLYGHPESTHTYPGGRRDFVEWALMKQAIAMEIPIIGICRGAQMLCAGAGGYLIQDVLNHGQTHLVKTINGDEIKVNSLHHQMMFPYAVDHKLLAWCEEPRSIRTVQSTNEGGEVVIDKTPHYIYNGDEQLIPDANFKEPEMVYFPKIKGLAIQWHPEMMTENAAATQFIFDQMEELGWL